MKKKYVLVRNLLTTVLFFINAHEAQATIVEKAYLKAANAQAFDYFGNAVSIDNDVAIVAAYGEDSNQTTVTNGTTASSDNSSSNAGAVYVYRKTNGIWQEEAYLKAANADPQDGFGYSLDVDDNLIVVTAPSESSNQTTVTNGPTASSDNSIPLAGAAYVYRKTNGIWQEEAYLKAANADPQDGFGYSLDVDDNLIVVTAPSESSNQTTVTNGPTASSDNFAIHSGAAYVYQNIGGNWQEVAYLKAANAELLDNFGISVAIWGNRIVIGDGEEDSSQTTVTNGSGASSDNSATNAGAAYVYKRNPNGNWYEEAYLKAANADSSDDFGGWGNTVAIAGDTIAVGAALEDSNQNYITNGTSASFDNSKSDSGAVYIYRLVNGDWSEEAYIKPQNTDSNDYFGQISLEGDTLVVGASGEDSSQTTITNGSGASSDNSATDAGAVYVFHREFISGVPIWSEIAYIKPANAEPNDNFGNSVAISGNNFIVGAWHEDSNQTTVTNGAGASSDNSATDAGAAYIFKNL